MTLPIVTLLIDIAGGLLLGAAVGTAAFYLLGDLLDCWGHFAAWRARRKKAAGGRP